MVTKTVKSERGIRNRDQDQGLEENWQNTHSGVLFEVQGWAPILQGNMARGKVTRWTDRKKKHI